MDDTPVAIHTNTTARVVEAIRKLGCDVETILPVHELDGDLGIDSTEIVELGVLVRKEFGVSEAVISLAGARTVAEVVARIDQHFAR